MRLVVVVVLRFLGELFVARGSPRSVFHFRCTPRCFVAPFVERLLGIDPSFLFWNTVSLLLCLEGLCLRNAVLLARPAYWANWADCLRMVQQRHPAVCLQVLRGLHNQNPGLRDSVEFLEARGVHPPLWEYLAAGQVGQLGTRPTATRLAARCHCSMVTTFSQPCGSGCLRLRKHFSVPKVVPLLASFSRVFPHHCRFDSSLFRVLLLRCVWQSLVAVFSTLLATTRQLVLRRRCWVARLRFKKRCSSCLSRGKSTGHDERDGQGFGPCATRPGGRSPPGSCGGRIASVQWSATRPGHHPCFTAEA